jgi:hypothetical protein
MEIMWFVENPDVDACEVRSSRPIRYRHWVPPGDAKNLTRLYPGIERRRSLSGPAQPATIVSFGPPGLRARCSRETRVISTVPAGQPQEKPWPESQPAAGRASACAVVSGSLGYRAPTQQPIGVVAFAESSITARMS